MRLAELFEEPMKGKITKVAGDNVEISDPKKPGITTKVDLKQMDIDDSNPNEPTIKPKSPKPQGQGAKIRPGQTVNISTEEKKKD
tara:strand:- start:6011 stop:6265 length:255 start_codon:yes stop_codon:yes gene_type:complete